MAKRSQYFSLIEDQIRNSDVIIEETKDDCIVKVLQALKKPVSTTLFEVKMILWKNRYDNVEKDKFLKWFDSTAIRDIL